MVFLSRRHAFVIAGAGLRTLRGAARSTHPRTPLPGADAESMEDPMRRILMAMCGSAAVLVLAGCADYGPNGYAGGYGPGYGSSYGDVWYDGFYGPYAGGYWDGDVFLFRGRDGRFRHGDANHFRHERFAAAQNFRTTRHGRGARSAMHSGANASATAPHRDWTHRH